MTIQSDPASTMIDVSGAQPIAQGIYRQVAAILLDHLGPDLVSLVAHGSAVKGGMIPGSSDLDYVAFVNSGALTPSGELPLSLTIDMHRDLARIDRGPFRYIQGKVYPAGSGPETGFIPGTYLIVTGSPDIPLASSDDLLAAASRDLANLDPAALRDRISNALLDHGEGRLSRQVRLLCTDVWPTMFQVAALALGDGLAAWQRTKPEIVGILGDDQVVGTPLREWMTAITHHHSDGESTGSALAALAAGVAFMEAAAVWYRSRRGKDS